MPTLCFHFGTYRLAYLNALQTIAEGWEGRFAGTPPEQVADEMLITAHCAGHCALITAHSFSAAAIAES